MRLDELFPHWLYLDEGRIGQAMSFLCPHCQEFRLFAFIRNPIDGLANVEGARCLGMEWDSFDNITFDDVVFAPYGHGAWRVVNGEVIAAEGYEVHDREGWEAL
jgi:hypothetical protein